MRDLNPKCLYRNISIEDIFLQDVYIFIKVSNHLKNSLHDFLFFIFLKIIPLTLNAIT